MLTGWYLACQSLKEEEDGLSAERYLAEGCCVNKAQIKWPLRDEDEQRLVIERIPAERSFKSKAYAALKDAITNLDIYRSTEPVMLDERELSERLGVSRTPIREAVAMLEQEGFVRTVPRRGILVVRKTKREIVEMIQAWAALEGMAARLITAGANASEIGALRELFNAFGREHVALDHLDEYSSANIDFHQSLIRLSGSGMLVAMTDNLLLHVKAIRHRTIFERDRAQRSIRDHMEIIQALEARDADRAERLVRDHTLRLAEHVENHVDLG